MESFYTIQGEGYNTGKAAYFIRLAGCDVACVWCDVKDSWDASRHPLCSEAQLLENASTFPGRNLVITGGEPLMHNCDAICQTFKNAGFQLWIETSGAYQISGQWDWICVSPKKFKAALPSVLAAANELKVVIYHKSDFAWAQEQAAGCASTCKLYLQPEWSKKEQMMPLIVDFVKENPAWQVSLQTHKYLQIP